MTKKNFSTPDEVRTPDKTRVEVIKLDNVEMTRGTFQPGWKWSDCIKPVVGTDMCMQHHKLYVVSGKMKVKTKDGKVLEIGPGDVADIPPEHDAWVVGNEPCISIDFAAKDYAKK